MRFLRHSLTGLFLLSLTVALLIYAGQLVFGALQERMGNEPSVPDRRERVFAVNLVTAEAATVTPVLTAYGEARSLRTLEIRAKASGTLIELSEEFEDGGMVEKGQILARIDPADARSALNLAESDLMDARAELREAESALEIARDELEAAREQAALRERAFQRQLDLEDRGVGTAAAVETAELSAAQARQAELASRQALANAEARVDQARTRLSRSEIARDDAQRRLEETTIRAEFGGTLDTVNAVAGGFVSLNERLANLIDTDALEVAFRVSTAQYVRLLDDTGALLDAPVLASLATQGLELQTTGRITRDSGAVEEGQTGRMIFAKLDKAGGLKPGDFITVRIEEPPLDDAIRLPATALGPDGTVLILSAEERLEALPVRLLRRQGDDVLVRAEGLSGREVVAQRSPLLGAGIKVRPLREQSEADTSKLMDLSDERRAQLIEFIRDNTQMPEAEKTRLLAQLEQVQVPAGMVQRLETRMGG
ncbi:efflux RND transporter periplasmic adaptor subunit [Roseovarius sp. MMSF_3281]|uniref:efflux RND transporter periplasmic adaptor subunit n=1 Tax=Roseovarius sp. MMSF_3281 TaxID=3046694 RepID=UPI00273FB452|nr:HlyD family efflux transporter periplasmic adaptor subunit [Roseovarius sp. MMSF_3281]